MTYARTRSLAVVVMGLVAFAACQAGTGDTLPAGMGRLAVELVDAPAPQVKEVVVTINKVTAHSTSAGWVTIMSTPVTVDLLTLQTQSMALGFANLPPGKVTQIRLYVDDPGPRYVTLPNGDRVDLKTPSGVQSGIKIKGPFEISACETSTVTIDFDGKKSLWVHPTGQGDEWILRPVIHTKKVVSSATPCEPGGTADAGTGSNPPGGSTDAGTSTQTDGGGINEGGGNGGGNAPGNPPGAPCNESGQCRSGVCSNGACSSGGPGTPCNAANDCASGTCTSEGVCANGTAGGNGSACTAASSCLSNACVNGVCEAGGTGSACVATADCFEGLTCVNSACTIVIN